MYKNGLKFTAVKPVKPETLIVLGEKFRLHAYRVTEPSLNSALNRRTA